MSQVTIVRSFAELAEVLDPTELEEDDGPGEPEEGRDGLTAAALESGGFPEQPAIGVDPIPDLAALLAELEAASQTLGEVARRDQAARVQALRDLDRYDSLVATLAEARRARERAAGVRSEAEDFTKQAFTPETQGAATRLRDVAVQAELAATRVIAELEEETTGLARRLDLERLIAERQREEEAEKARAAELVRARRLSAALASAREALETGQLEEAEALLGAAANENPDNADVASLKNTIAQKELTVKTLAAEEALRLARREGRADLAAAVQRLSQLELAGLPSSVVGQVFGEWARACARLCRERGLQEPLRYAPDPGRGAVLAREAEGEPYVVVSSIGLEQAYWREGKRATPWEVNRARPLRYSR